MSFLPRTAFSFPDVTRSYFLGHHSAALQQLKTLLSHIDLVLECRDARIPFSSFNPLLENALRGKTRSVVLTKGDLCGRGEEARVAKVVKELGIVGGAGGGDVIPCRNVERKAVKKVLDLAKEAARSVDSVIGARMVVVGMPNVGKSSLLNALRAVGVGKGKAERTGGQPGVTRKVGTSVKVCEDPDVYLIDTPGVFIPYVSSAETMIKLALVGCVKDTLVAPSTLVDYLLFRINQLNPSIYSEYSPPTNDVTEFLTAVANKTGRLAKGGIPELESAALWILQRYRAGLMGKFVLDDVSPEGVEQWKQAMEIGEVSKSMARRRAKEERLKASREKFKKRTSTTVEA